MTAYDQYAMRAFDVHAVDYLLKPFERGRLRTALVRAAALAGSGGNPGRLHALVDTVRADRPLQRFLVKTPGRVYAVRAADVESLESAGHYIELRTATGPTSCATRWPPSSGGSTPRDRPHPSMGDREHRQGEGAASSLPRRIRGHPRGRPAPALQPDLRGRADPRHVGLNVCTRPYEWRRMPAACKTH